MPGACTGQVSTSASIQDPARAAAARYVLRAAATRADTADQAAGLARMLKALADPTRLRLVSLVAARRR
jgi:hypothetical protein